MRKFNAISSTSRVVALILATVMLLSAVAVLVFPASADEAYTYVSYTQANTDKVPKKVEENTVLGLRLGINGSFDSVALSLCTWSTTDSAARLSLYKWEKNSKTTESGKPIATAFMENLTDNGMATLTFETQPAGEYYILVSETRGSVGVWAVAGNSMTGGLMYVNGSEEPQDLCLSVRFTSKPEKFFTTLTTEERDTETNPIQADNVPKDSLFHKNSAMPDTWVFTDGLGRVSLTYAEVGPVREGKTLALFYWTWHEELGQQGATNTTELMKQYPDAKNDYHHKAWTGTGHYCFWNEPIYGFYRTTDEWVLRKQAELLANAGVDVVFNDNTNGAMTWKSGYHALFENWIQATEDGVKAPKISFMLPFGDNGGSRSQLSSLYNDIYKNGTYQELWYYLDDKPMLMAHGSGLSGDYQEIKDFFTFRGGQPLYLLGGNTNIGEWGWLHTFPQPVYYGTRLQKREKTPEQITVGVAMNHNYVTHEITAMNGENVMGRSYTSTYPNRYEEEGDSASLWGYNFSEQFDRALEMDPMVVFVTGWNEWHAWRQPTPWGGPNSLVNNALVDQFDNEHSRDLEPTKGELKDHYYYLFVNYARRYKGVNPIPTPSYNQTIDMNAGEAQWKSVEPYYASYINNIGDRDHAGYRGYSYTEKSGRNDLIGAQVARDDDYLYFHVECASDIVGLGNDLWMTLYIDSDQQNQGWESFDYVINKTRATQNAVILERFTGNGYETEKVAECAYKLDGRYLTVKVSKADLGISGDDYTVNFSWTDNVHDEGDETTFSGDILDFYISGDVAPGGRFKYSFISSSANARPAETDTDPVTGTVTETIPATAIESDSETEALSDTETTTEAETTGTSKDGCKSVMSGVAMLLILGAVAVAVPALRKRD